MRFGVSEAYGIYGRYFRNFFSSAFALRRISDSLCVEHGLSIVENPSKNYDGYNKWLGSKKALSYLDQLKLTIDAALKRKPATFEIFLDSMRAAGYTINTERKHIAFLFPGQKSPTRCDTPRGYYTEAAILDVSIPKGMRH
jgi:hypothetical protein